MVNHKFITTDEKENFIWHNIQFKYKVEGSKQGLFTRFRYKNNTLTLLVIKLFLFL